MNTLSSSDTFDNDDISYTNGPDDTDDTDDTIDTMDTDDTDQT